MNFTGQAGQAPREIDISRAGPGRFHVGLRSLRSGLAWARDSKKRWSSVTIFISDVSGTVAQHDGNFSTVDGFPVFDGSEFGG